MNLRTYLTIKQAGNPVNKLKAQTFKGMTDPDYANKSMGAGLDQLNNLGVFNGDRQSTLDDLVKTYNNGLYGQDTIPDDVLANPGQGLRSRGLDKVFGNDAGFNAALQIKRKGLKL